ncbi:ABC transporter ATP-binding protein [Algibacter agarivorans]|uniref:ABC transporter ATP-binding protein n=1 Tax=Algibacter agarivorans TaxID=1109741 RepID=A0ABP9GHS2_9FLAO
MSDIILKAENISKQYRLGLVSSGTLSHDLTRWWHRVRGKGDPFLKIGETNDRSTKGDSDYVWALRDINFEVKRGEVLGIIGKNGAGKSTLLKILSRVTSPTTGEIKTKGRIASLLEVGTGFHPEMTGRENIYLNGAILGMTKKEIASKIDEIIEFSGCQRYIDTPVKRYSSGMRVRLAFAVAAHLEPDILVIDEVLAVGDAEFQKKAIGKMQDISKGEGRTVLFVSHNMAAVKNLCTRGIVLEHGKVVFEGSQSSAIDFYTSLGLNKFNEEARHHNDNGVVSNFNFTVLKENKEILNSNSILLGARLIFNFNFNIIKETNDLSISFDFFNLQNELICHVTNEDSGYYISKAQKGSNLNINVITDRILFIPGRYFVNFWIGTAHIETVYQVENIFNFQIEQSGFTKRTKPLPTHAKLYLNTKWD